MLGFTGRSGGGKTSIGGPRMIGRSGGSGIGRRIGGKPGIGIGTVMMIMGASSTPGASGSPRSLSLGGLVGGASATSVGNATAESTTGTTSASTWEVTSESTGGASVESVGGAIPKSVGTERSSRTSAPPPQLQILMTSFCHSHVRILHFKCAKIQARHSSLSIRNFGFTNFRCQQIDVVTTASQHDVGRPVRSRNKFRTVRVALCYNPHERPKELKAVMTERVWYIKECQLFSRLTDEQLARLERRGRMRTFPRNSTVYMPSDVGDGVFLLADGRVRISSITPDGKQAILAFIEPGELFGELSLVESGQREEYAETVVDSTIVLLPGDEVARLMGESAELTLGVTKLIGLRRKRIERRLRSLLFRSNRDRLTTLLLDLVEQYGRTTVEGVLLEIKLSHQDLASIIGATRETVTVLLGEMQLEGLLNVSRQRIVVRNLKKLADGIEVSPPQVPEKRRPIPVRRTAPAVGLDPPKTGEV